MCGCGPTSRFSCSAKQAGPMWSINTNGPIDLFCRNGSKRPTKKLPISAACSSRMKSIFDISVFIYGKSLANEYSKFSLAVLNIYNYLDFLNILTKKKVTVKKKDQQLRQK